MTQAAGPKLKRKDLYYFDLVVFQVRGSFVRKYTWEFYWQRGKVENALFKVPRNHFVASSVFATIFTLPSGGAGAEGTEDKPFVLHGVAEVDFEALLKLMYPPPL
jgi:hypothetical protein